MDLHRGAQRVVDETELVVLPHLDEPAIQGGMMAHVRVNTVMKQVETAATIFSGMPWVLNESKSPMLLGKVLELSGWGLGLGILSRVATGVAGFVESARWPSQASGLSV